MPEDRGVGRGLDLTVELLTAIGLWGGVGWLVDRWLATAPWGLVIGFLVGNACGIYLLWLHSRGEGTRDRLQRAKAERSAEHHDHQTTTRARGGEDRADR